MPDTSPKVLIVEDDAFLREMLVSRLEKEGFKVIFAKDGEEGVNKAVEEKPDIIVLDIILPGIDGFEVLRRLREEEEIAPQTASIPVLVLSNAGDPQTEEKLRALRAERFLLKATVTIPEIIQTIKNMLKLA